MTETKTKILVVDDDLRLRDLLHRYLGEQGFAVRAVSEAHAMDKLLAHERFDLIFVLNRNAHGKSFRKDAAGSRPRCAPA